MKEFEKIKLRQQMKFRMDNAMQISSEIESLQDKVISNNPKIILEIGTANGGTLARWFEIPSVDTIFSIDLPNGIHGGQGFQERTYVISDAIEQANTTNKYFFPINGDSKNPYLVSRLRELLNGRKIDFLFIDGDHTYEGVKKDFEIYKEFLNEGSLVAFHDIIDSQFHREEGCFVSKFWNELKSKYECHEYVDSNSIKSNLIELYNISKDKGGFGGIGVLKYNTKSIEYNLSLIVPIYNNAEMAIKNTLTILETSSSINDVIFYSNGSDSEENDKLIEFSHNNSLINLIIENRQVGFVKAVNESIKKTKNNLILCVNSDAVLFGDWESRLNKFWNDNSFGLVGPILCDDFILGSCFLMKKSVMNKIGLLNEGFGLGYYDDNELSDRVFRNGYKLGYGIKIDSNNWPKTTVEFPFTHIQGVSFNQIETNIKNKILELNKEKWLNFKSSKSVEVYKNFSYNELKRVLDKNEVSVIINNSGDEFEKIRFDNQIIESSNIFECTDEMDIDELINSICNGKKINIKEPSKNEKITWLAKFDDYASMGILSQRVIEKLTSDVSCESIIGDTETNNKIILDKLKKNKNHDLGIMFAYPNMYPVLNDYKTKVIYTGVDSTGGIANFAQNANNADFLLTPSYKSKQRMEKLGVTKPIFVFPHGVDPKVFKYKEKGNTFIFKFLYVGECSDRKGIFQLLDAFIELYGGSQFVELHIKSNSDMVFYNSEDVNIIKRNYPNIFWHVSNQGHDEIIKLYDECQAYVYPSRADTFGMTLFEAMACGLPIISTNEPGATEFIQGKYFEVESESVPVKNHPWMLGEWGEANVENLKKQMDFVYRNYNEIISDGKLKEYSDYITQNYSWDKVTENFESEILPKLTKKVKVITLLTSFNRPHHIKNVINSLKGVRETEIENHVYIVENSDIQHKRDCLSVIQNNIDKHFTLYDSDFNMGQRGALLQMLEDINIDDYEYVQFTDQDNLFEEPLSTYCHVLLENPDIKIVTGYMSKEHGELAWRHTRHGNLCEKRSCRAGHMFMRVSDLKSLYPIHLDGQYGQPHNSSWNAGLDWELQYWNKNGFGRRSENNFILCLPGGVLHKGVDSTMYDWPVEENEYSLEELIKLRNQIKNPT